MNREVHVRFWERAEVQFLRATRHNENPSLEGLCQLLPAADMSLHWVSSESCRFCCKSPKLPDANFPAVKKIRLTTADSCALNRVTKVVSEFIVRR